jgi:hypothetical protein
MRECRCVEPALICHLSDVTRELALILLARLLSVSSRLLPISFLAAVTSLVPFLSTSFPFALTRTFLCFVQRSKKLFSFGQVSDFFPLP